ncbi:MAG: multidrug efflux SMR transporter [Desulfovibrionaceae bacterium]
MRYLWLMSAILFEVAGTGALKASEGFTKLWPSLLMAVYYAISLVFLNLAAKRFDISVLYAIWSGVGVALVSMVGVVVFHESFTPAKVLSLVCIVAGVAGLHLADSA